MCGCVCVHYDKHFLASLPDPLGVWRLWGGLRPHVRFHPRSRHFVTNSVRCPRRRFFQGKGCSLGWLQSRHVAVCECACQERCKERYWPGLFVGSSSLRSETSLAIFERRGPQPWPKRSLQWRTRIPHIRTHGGPCPRDPLDISAHRTLSQPSAQNPVIG